MSPNINSFSQEILHYHPVVIKETTLLRRYSSSSMVLVCLPFLQFSLFYILAFILVICGVFIYNLKPPTTRQSPSAESQDKDLSQNRKGDGTAVRQGGGLLETQTIDMSSNVRTRSSSVGGLYGSIEREPSKPSNSAHSEHAVKP